MKTACEFSTKVIINRSTKDHVLSSILLFVHLAVRFKYISFVKSSVYRTYTRVL